MIELLTSILPLAAGAAVSPTLLAVTIAMLSAKTRPVARSAAFAAGGLLVLIAITVLATTVIRVSASGVDVRQRSGAIDLVLAGLVFGLGLKIATSKPGDDGRPKGSEPDSEPHFLKVFLIGLAAMATNFSTIALYMSAMKQVALADAALLAKVAATMVALAFAALPMLGPLALVAVAPVRSKRWLEPMGRVVTRYGRHISVALCMGFGIYLAVRGFRAM